MDLFLKAAAAVLLAVILYLVVNNRSKEQIVVGGNNVDYTMKENPFFVNPSIGDYRIREDADFLKIPYEKIGRY
jgi:hypothetical protein